MFNQIRRAVRFVPYADAAHRTWQAVLWLVSTIGTAVAWANNVMDWLNAFAPLGSFWYVLVFVALALCISLIMLLAALGVYVFGRRHTTATGTDIELPSEQSSADTGPCNSLPEPARREPETFERCLYLGQVIFSCERAHEHLLGIDMSCFNGSAEEIDVLSIRGHIAAEKTCNDGIRVEVGRLETPQIRSDKTSMHIKPFSEFNFLFWQHIPGEIADRLVAGADKDDIELQFDFEELDIQLCKSSDSSARAKLCLWDGATFVKLANYSCTHRSRIIRLGSGSAKVVG